MGSNAQKGKRINFNVRDFTSIFGLVLLVVLSAILSPTFLKPLNIMNVLVQIAATSLLAFGMTFVILTGGIDLSVASVLALSGVIVALFCASMAWYIAVILALFSGVVIGVLHGVFITRFNVPPFIATLAGLTICRGLALFLTNAAAVPIDDSSFSRVLAGKIDSTITLIIAIVAVLLLIFNYVVSFKKLDKTELISKTATMVISLVVIVLMQYFGMKISGISIQIIIVIGLILILNFILTKTIFGRQVYAMGGNYEAARLAGIKTKKNLMIVYSLSGFLSALGGVLVTARLGSGTPQTAQGGELDAIAAVVIGGTSMSGGIGTLGGTIIGVLLIGVLNNLLSLLGVQSDMKSIFKGVIILVAVIMDTRFRRKK